MSTARIIGVILLSAVITFTLRALPFLLFHGERRMPQSLVALGKILPSAIMAVLIVYCLKDVGSDWSHIGIPKLVSVAVVAFSYKWKHNTLVSILAGTACYMALLQFIPLVF
jgi:branched-subunit amino acid transport protein AzlD